MLSSICRLRRCVQDHTVSKPDGEISDTAARDLAGFLIRAADAQAVANLLAVAAAQTEIDAVLQLQGAELPGRIS